MSLPVKRPVRRRSPFDASLSAVTIALVLVAIVLGILWVIPANSYVLTPGDALPVSPMIAVQHHPPVRATGNLYMTDVNIFPAHHYIEELYGRLRPHSQIVPIPSISGGLSDAQYFQLNDQLMHGSKESAEAAALRAAGYTIHFSTNGPEVVFTMPGTPAATLLQAGDVIESVDGHRTRRAVDVAPLVRRLTPGDVIHLVVLRHGKRLHVDPRTIPSTNGQPNKRGKTALIGVVLQDQLVIPVKISINSGSIGGPSAGLMFTLGIYERLKQRDITHGCQVAGTGTIDADGNVGPIGDAEQKIVAAHNAGARYFFVPDVRDHDNLLGALAGKDGITVVPVKTLRQALSYLAHLKPCR